MVPTLWQRVLFYIHGTNIIELLLALLLNMAMVSRNSQSQSYSHFSQEIE